MKIRSLALLGTLAVSLPIAAEAQLRPYEPLDWTIFDSHSAVVASFGASWLKDQRASLAGSTGQLLELGTFAATYRTGRVGLTVEGVPIRIYSEDGTFASPYGGALPDADGRRVDAGDFRLSTALLLTPPKAPYAGIVRFGTRLPTTDNRVGLERDQTDFFATLGGRLTSAAVVATAEVGVGIHGTREAEYEQSDVLVYLLGAELRRASFRPSILVLGHLDGLSGRSIRGNEELAEVRLRLRTGGARWVQGEVIRGLTDFSPSVGVGIAVGGTFF